MLLISRLVARGRRSRIGALWNVEARRRRARVQGQQAFDIDGMPRAGPDASWLDRQLRTERPEYLDHDGIDPRKRQVVRSMDWLGRVFRHHQTFARIALDEVAGVPDARILELGAAHGGLSRALLKMHPTAHATVTDVENMSVAAIAANDLGDHPRALVCTKDATAIDDPDESYDLAVFAMSLHHLRPALASRVFAEGTRVADKLLIIDVQRLPALLLVVQLALSLPLSKLVPVVHDAWISNLRAYSPSALRALAHHADPAIELQLRGGLNLPVVLPQPQIVVASRRPGL